MNINNNDKLNKIQIKELIRSLDINEKSSNKENLFVSIISSNKNYNLHLNNEDYSYLIEKLNFNQKENEIPNVWYVLKYNFLQELNMNNENLLNLLNKTNNLIEIYDGEMILNYLKYTHGKLPKIEKYIFNLIFNKNNNNQKIFEEEIIKDQIFIRSKHFILKEKYFDLNKIFLLLNEENKEIFFEMTKKIDNEELKILRENFNIKKEIISKKKNNKIRKI